MGRLIPPGAGRATAPGAGLAAVGPESVREAGRGRAPRIGRTGERIPPVARGPMDWACAVAMARVAGTAVMVWPVAALIRSTGGPKLPPRDTWLESGWAALTMPIVARPLTATRAMGCVKWVSPTAIQPGCPKPKTTPRGPSGAQPT